MSRLRTLYALACAGILITTGGCAEMATAPEAATAEQGSVSENRESKPTGNGKPTTGGTVTIQSGYISVGD
ncbi:hypothetical protein [Longimicrobium sp.]|uniref:hypothetical protein n=1 Tax=Longimicrobium sp. TaxID=2029185 RepID=UPI003B3AEBDF